MTYVPLARKYRPQTFEELIGQSHVTTTLARALESKRLAQAYLFTGTRGVGKTSAARILAACLNCAKGPTPTPCRECDTCTQIAKGNNLDVIEIDGASNRGIDEIRSLRESVPFAPTSGAFRVYIIDEVHMLTTEAFNALLKTLEEPPAHVKFIFATTAPSKVPATILSRCQRFDFRRIDTAIIVQALHRIATAERIAVDDAALYAVARAADGSLRDAEVILEQLASFAGGAITEAHVTELLGAIESEALQAWVQAILDRNAPEALASLMRQLEQGKEPPQLLTGLARHLRNLMVVASIRDAPSAGTLLASLIDEPPERISRLEVQAKPLSPQELLLLLQLATGAQELIRRSPMAQTILELIVLKLATREQWQSLDEISRRIERLAQTGTTPRPLPSSVPEAQPLQRSQPEETPAITTETSAEPAAETTPMPAATPGELTTLWTAFLAQLSAQKMSLAAYLAQARPLYLAEGTLTVGLPSFALHQEVLNLTEHRRLITKLLSQLCGAAVTVDYVTLPELTESARTASPSETVSPQPPIVQDIVKLFNATVLDRPGTASP